jgi:dimethylhistidine N-methyltransferase
MSTFKEDVWAGLCQKPKRLPSRYFYDDKGSALFQEIMDLEEYYLPRCELEILELRAEQMARMTARQGLEIIELGAGDGSKIIHLLSALWQIEPDISYIPLDISPFAVKENEGHLRKHLPGLKLGGVAGNYFKTLPVLMERPTPKLLLFMGSNLGNFPDEKAVEFLSWLQSLMHPGDGLLLAVDLKKDPATILRAYNDAKGITKAFNLNLLARINKELGANFNLEAWDHWPLYEPVSGAAKSYLISLTEQEVVFPGEGTITFEAFEAIHTEVSQKFTLQGIQDLAAKSGMQWKESFTDKKGYYAIGLFFKK